MSTRRGGAAASAKKAKKIKSPTKAQTISLLGEKSNLSKTQVTLVISALNTIIKENLNKYGVFTIPGLVKISVGDKKAVPAHPGRNPFTGLAIIVKAKPARKVIRLRALKPLRDMI